MRPVRSRLRASSRRSIAIAAACGAVAAASFGLRSANVARAQDQKSGASPSAGKAAPADEGELGADARACLDGALRWLAEHQGEGGAVRGDREQEHQDVAATALAGLAWLASGSSQNRGPYARNIENALQYLVKIKKPGPRGFGLRFHDDKQLQSRMHAHGFATLFLAELYGMAAGGARADRAATLRDLLKPAVQLSIRSQTPKGGWGYAFAGESEFEMFHHDEGSTTITQIQALRAARNAGMDVPPATIDAAVEYVKKSMRGMKGKPFGEARYSLSAGEGSDRTSFELTAAAVATLNASGVYRSPELEAGLAALKRWMAKKENRLAAAESYYFYGNLYAAQSMFQSGGDDWASWFKDAQQDLIARARRRGDQVWWEDDRKFGDATATAMACLVLEIPLRYLPIFER